MSPRQSPNNSLPVRPADPAEFAERRKFPIRRFMAGIVTTALVVAGGYEAHKIYHTDRVPSWMLDAAPLPDKNKLEEPIEICAANEPCDTSHALSWRQADAYTPVKTSDIPQFCANALVAIEDKTYATNNGVSGRGLLRAILYDIFHGTLSNIRNYKKGLSLSAFGAEGGSTITRQYASIQYVRSSGNRYLDNYTEMKYALTIAATESKSQTLTEYFNTTQFRSGTRGIEAAAESMFHKHASDLSDAECVYMAIQPQAPSSYSIPYDYATHQAQAATDMTRMRDRYHLDTEDLYSQGYISDAKRQTLNAEVDKNFTIVMDKQNGNLVPKTDITVPFYPDTSVGDGSSARARELGALGFTQYAKWEAVKALGFQIDPKDPNAAVNEMYKKYPGIKIVTTLNTEDQQALNNAVNGAAIVRDNPKLDAASVAVDRTGAVQAMYSGKDPNSPNRAIGTEYGQGSGRDAGSINKTPALAYAYDHGWTATSDEPGRAYHPLVIPKTISVPTENGVNWYIHKGDYCSSLGMQPPCKMTPNQAYTVSSDMLPARIVMAFGSSKIAIKMYQQGLPVTDPKNPTFTIGEDGTYSPLNEAGAYASYLNAGSSVDTHVLKAVYDGNGRALYKYSDHAPKPTKIFSKKATKMVVSSMQSVTQSGTAARIFNVPNGRLSIAGKTGTGQRDDWWFAGLAGDPHKGAQALVTWIGDPTGNDFNSSIDHSSRVAAIMNSYVTATMTSGQAYNILDAVRSPKS